MITITYTNSCRLLTFDHYLVLRTKLNALTTAKLQQLNTKCAPIGINQIGIEPAVESRHLTIGSALTLFESGLHLDRTVEYLALHGDKPLHDSRLLPINQLRQIDIVTIVSVF